MAAFRVNRPLNALRLGIFLALSAVTAAAPALRGAEVREVIAAAITAPSAGEQREMVLALKSTPSPEVVLWLENWKEGKIFIHEDADGKTTPVLLSGEADAEKTFAIVRLDNGAPMLAPDGGVVRINPRFVDFADTSSGLRKAMKEVFEIAALADPDPEKRIRAIQDSAVGQKLEKLPALESLKSLGEGPRRPAGAR